MEDMWNSIQQMIRIAMNAVGAWLVAKGWPGEITEMISGIALSGSAVGWWVYWNFWGTKSVEAPKKK